MPSDKLYRQFNPHHQMNAGFAAELERYGPQDRGEDPISLDQARTYCRNLARTHYENFSVVSWLLPRELRQHFSNIYGYCRWADDLADEVDDPQHSLQLLAWWREQLDQCYQHRHSHPVFIALADTITRFNIPRQPFADLLAAFEQDQEKRRYATWEELLGYCRCSADPVGRLVLHLIGEAEPTNMALADQVCTGLQLANFCQDVAGDHARGRIYLPREDWERFGYSESDFEGQVANQAWRNLMAYQVDRAEGCLREGQPLVRRVPRRYRGQIALFVSGGLSILREIRRVQYDVWTCRPTLGRWTKIRLIAQALTGRAGL